MISLLWTTFWLELIILISAADLLQQVMLHVTLQINQIFHLNFDIILLFHDCESGYPKQVGIPSEGWTLPPP